MTVSALITVVFTVLYFACSLLYLRGLKIGTKELCVSGLIIPLTLILESLRIPLPTGTTTPLSSPVPLMLLAVLWDGRLALVSRWVCGILVMFLIPGWQPVHWGQFFVEHLVCFSSLGYAGLFGHDRRWKVLCGLTLASLLKLTGHVLSGVVFFSQNAWDGWGAWGYSITYHLSCKIPEGTATALIMLGLPLDTIKKAIGGNRR